MTDHSRQQGNGARRDVPSDDLDAVLASEPGVVPSARFAQAVMGHVRCESALARAIAFPWRRAAAGLALAAIGALALTCVCVLAPDIATKVTAPAGFPRLQSSGLAVIIATMLATLALVGATTEKGSG